MSRLEPGPLASYNSLQDKHLGGYFANTKMKKHLKKSGLVTRDGHIVNENFYRLKMAKKEHQKHVRDLLATAIVHKAFDMERLRQYEIRKKMDELYKVELVQRVKTERSRKGDEDIMPLLSPQFSSSTPRSTPASFRLRRKTSDASHGTEEEPITERQLPEIRYDKTKKRLYYKNASGPVTTNIDYGMMIDTEETPYSRGHRWPHPPPPRKKKKAKLHRGLLLARTDTTIAHRIQLQSMAEVTMKFLGPQVHLTSDMFPRDKVHEVMVLQQHCGGSTLCVFRELLPGNTIFTLVSRRHRGSPFGLTIYIDSIQNCRLSCCCEYKHKPGYKLGGKHGRFRFVGVTGAAPCYKCQVAFSVAHENERHRSNQHVDHQEAQESETEEAGQGFDIIVGTVPKINEEERKQDSSKSTVAVQTDDIEFPKLEESKSADTIEGVNKQELASTEPTNYDDEQFEDKEDADSDNEAIVSNNSSKYKNPNSDKNPDSDRSDSDSEIESEKENDKEKHNNDSFKSDLENDEVYSENEANQKENKINDDYADEFEPEDVEHEKSEREIASSKASIEEEVADSGDENQVIEEIEEDKNDSDIVEDKQDNHVIEADDSHIETDKDNNVDDNKDVVEQNRKKEPEFKGEEKDDNITDKPNIQDKGYIESEEEVKDNGVLSEENNEIPDNESQSHTDNTEHTEKPTGEAVEAEVLGKKEETDTPSNYRDPDAPVDLNNSFDLDSPVDLDAPVDMDSPIPYVPVEELIKPAEDFSDQSNDHQHFDKGHIADESQNALGTEPKLSGSVISLIDSTQNMELNSISLTPEQVDEVSKLVEENTDNIDSLSLRSGSLDDDGVEKIKESVNNADNLKLLNLTGNIIGPDGAKHLAEVLKENKKIKIVMLHGNPLGNEGVSHLTDVLMESKSVTTFDVGDCQIGDQGAQHIADMLYENESITDINLSGNAISSKGWKAISEALKINCSLTTLSLDFSNLGDEGITILAEGISNNSSLQSLDLEGNKIGNAGAEKLLEAIRTNKSIVDVTLMPLNNISKELLDIIKAELRGRIG